MVNGQLKLLVDTNVWLDLYIPDRANADFSRRMHTMGVRENAAILFPLRSLNDAYWQVLRDRKRWIAAEYGSVSKAGARAANTDAGRCVDAMMEVGAPVGADGSDVWVAQHLRDIHGDFENDMVLAAAERAKVDYLVTSDQRLIQKATVAALAPQDMLAVLRLRNEESSTCKSDY